MKAAALAWGGKMSKFWAPIVPPIVEIRDETVEKNSNEFNGTHMRFHARQPYIKEFESSTDGPFGLPKPPFPTGATRWKKDDPHRIRTSAEIHMSPDAVEEMRKNEEMFATIMSSVTKSPASAFFQLGHAIYKHGLKKAKNEDGSLDIRIRPEGMTAGGQVVLIDAPLAMALMQIA